MKSEASIPVTAQFLKCKDSIQRKTKQRKRHFEKRFEYDEVRFTSSTKGHEMSHL